MRLPDVIPLLILVLGTYRIVRLIGWDDLPPLVRFRGRLTGEVVYQDPTKSADLIYRYERPLLAHFLGCAFCQGFWVSLAVCGGWWASSLWSVYALAPFALSAAVGLIARNLD